MEDNGLLSDGEAAAPPGAPPAETSSADLVHTEDEVAARYKVSPATVKNWRRTRTGPLYFYAGRHVRYRESALAAWEKEQERLAAEHAS
jgi:hypothetical protein